MPTTPSAGLAYYGLYGMGRSGTTYLESRLASATNAVAVGELPSLMTAIGDVARFCSCGAKAGDCPFWTAVRASAPWLADPSRGSAMTRMNRMVLPVRRAWAWPMLFAAFRWRRPRPVVDAYQTNLREMYGAVLAAAERHGYSAVIDSSKHPLWLEGVKASGALEGFGKVHIIRLVRDPRAVSYSLARPHSERTLRGDRVIQHKYSPFKALPYWAVMNVFADWAARSCGPKKVRYEDLSDELISKLAATGPVGRGGSHQLIGNPSRFEPLTNSFQADERWHEASPSRLERVMWRLARPLLRHYGYG